MDMEVDEPLISVVTAVSSSPSWDDIPNSSMFYEMEVREHQEVKVSYAEMDLFMNLLCSPSSRFAKETSILYFRRLFSSEMPEGNYPNTSILVESILKHMKQDRMFVSKESLIDAAWVLTNLVCISNDKCHVVVDKGAIQILVDLIRDAPPSSELKLQCIWAIGNIAADCATCKARCRATDIVTIIGNTLDKEEYRGFKEMKNVIWCTLNIVRGGIMNLSLDTVRQIVNACYSVLLRFKNNYTFVSDAIWCIAALADDMPLGRQIETVVQQPGLVDTIMRIFIKARVTPDSTNSQQHGCLRILGNILTGNDRQTDYVVTHPNFYKLIKMALMSVRKNIQREAAWMCSNVAASNDDHAEYLFEDDDVFNILFHEACRSDFDPKMQLECKWALTNLISTASTDRASWLIGAGVFSAFPYLVCSNQPRLVERSVRCLITMLTERPHYIGLVRNLQVPDKINATALQQIPELREMKEQLENIIKSKINKKRKHTFECSPQKKRVIGV